MILRRFGLPAVAIAIWSTVAWLPLGPVRAAPREKVATAQSSAAEHQRAQIAAAKRDLELAQLRLERFRRYEYPLEIRRLESAIRIAKAELDMFERQVREYERFTKFKDSSPLFTSLEYARINRLKAETTLRDLREEKRLVENNRRRQERLLRLEVEAAEQRLDSLIQPVEMRTKPRDRSHSRFTKRWGR